MPNLHLQFGMAWCAGFGSAFWAAYHELLPRQPGFDARADLYELYHKLNHYNLWVLQLLGWVACWVTPLRMQRCLQQHWAGQLPSCPQRPVHLGMPCAPACPPSMQVWKWVSWRLRAAAVTARQEAQIRCTIWVHTAWDAGDAFALYGWQQPLTRCHPLTAGPVFGGPSNAAPAGGQDFWEDFRGNGSVSTQQCQATIKS